MEGWSIGVLEYWSTRVLECSNSARLESNVATEAGAKGAAGLLPRADQDATLEQPDVKIREQAASRHWFAGRAVAAQCEDFQSLLAPEPDLRHVESTVDFELAEAARGESDFQGEIRKLLLFVKTPRFIRL